MKIQFKNNEGHVINLSSKMTISELLKLGFKEIRLLSPEAPLPDNWYRDVSGDKTPNNSSSATIRAKEDSK